MKKCYKTRREKKYTFIRNLLLFNLMMVEVSRILKRFELKIIVVLII